MVATEFEPKVVLLMESSREKRAEDTLGALLLENDVKKKWVLAPKYVLVL